MNYGRHPVAWQPKFSLKSLWPFWNTTFCLILSILLIPHGLFWAESSSWVDRLANTVQLLFPTFWVYVYEKKSCADFWGNCQCITYHNWWKCNYSVFWATMVPLASPCPILGQNGHWKAVHYSKVSCDWSNTSLRRLSSKKKREKLHVSLIQGRQGDSQEYQIPIICWPFILLQKGFWKLRLKNLHRESGMDREKWQSEPRKNGVARHEIDWLG